MNTETETDNKPQYIEIVNGHGEHRKVELLALDNEHCTVADDHHVYVIRLGRVTNWAVSV